MTDFIVCFDTETTGLDVQHDAIIQLSLVKFDARTFEEVDARDWYILPAGPFTIDPSAEAVHHISRAKLEQEGVSLRAIFPQFCDFVQGCDLLSYNGNSFDVRILYYNFTREGLTFDFAAHTFYDAFVIESIRTSRRLADVYRRYYGRDFDDAHNALADVRATIAVFQAQCQTSTDPAEFSRPEFDFVSLDGFLAIRDGRFVLAQGKHKGKSIAQVHRSDPSYLDWVCTTCAEPTRRTIAQYRLLPDTPEPAPLTNPQPAENQPTTPSKPKPRKPKKPTTPSSQTSLF